MDQEICQTEGWNKVGGNWGENNSGKTYVERVGPHQVKIGGGGGEGMEGKEGGKVNMNVNMTLLSREHPAGTDSLQVDQVVS
jgi:hypothetical protein